MSEQEFMVNKTGWWVMVKIDMAACEPYELEIRCPIYTYINDSLLF